MGGLSDLEARAIKEGGLITLDEFLKAKGCSRRQVYRRLDIPTTKIKGRVYVHRDALKVPIGGHEKAEANRKSREMRKAIAIQVLADELKAQTSRLNGIHDFKA